MKKAIIAVLLAALMLALFCAAGSATELAVENPLWDFGAYEIRNSDGVVVRREATLWGYKGGPDLVIPLRVYNEHDEHWYTVTAVHLEPISATLALSSLTFETDPLTNRTSASDVSIQNVSGVTSVTIPEGVQKLMIRKFYDLSSLTLSSTVTSAYEWAFADNIALKHFEWGGLRTVPRWAFANVGLEEIIVPDGTALVASAAFNNSTQLEKVYLPDSVVQLGDDVFNGCTALTDVRLPENEHITSLGLRFFQNCSSLETIHIPETVTKLDEWAFNGCSSLCHMNLPHALSELVITVFGGCDAVFDELTIPGTLEDATLLPRNVKKLTVEEGVLNMFGMWLNYTEEITLPASLVYLPAVTAAQKATVPTADYIQDSASTLEELTLTSTETMGGALTNFVKLRSVTLREGVTSLPDEAFLGASSLTAITIPSTVTSIGRNAFEGCTSLTAIAVPEGVEDLYEAFKGCTSLTSATLPSTLKTMRSAFEGCTSLGAVAVPAGVTNMNHAFCHSGVTSSNLPLSLTDAENAFEGCTRLASITLPEGLILPQGQQGFNIFSGCTALRSVTLPDSLTVLTIGMFQGSGLESITFPQGTETVAAYSFRNCKNLAQVSLPDSVTQIGIYAFDGCDALETVTLPDNTWFADGADAAFPDGITFRVNDGTTAADRARGFVQGHPNARYVFRDPLRVASGEITVTEGPAYDDEGNQREDYVTRVTVTAPQISPASDRLYYYFLVLDKNKNIRYDRAGDDASITFEVEDYWRTAKPYTVYVGVAYYDWVIGHDNQNIPYVREGYDAMLLNPVVWGSGSVVSLDANGAPLFSDERFDRVYLPSSLTVIESEAIRDTRFYGKFVVCPVGLTAIRTGAFADSHITAVFLPETVRSIASDAFSGCPVTVYCVSGSYAETWARGQGLPVVALSR